MKMIDVSVQAPANCVLVEDYPEYTNPDKNNTGADDNKKDDTGNSDKGSDAGNNTGNGVEIVGEDTENPNRYDTGIKAKDNSLITVDDSGNLIFIDKNNKVTILDRNAKYKLTTDKNGKVLLL